MKNEEWRMKYGRWRMEDGRKGVFKFISEVNYPGL